MLRQPVHHRGREQLRRRPPPAAETGSRSRGSGRRGQAPSQGAPADAGTATRKTAPQCRNQQSCGLLVSPRESPRGMGKEAERAGGRDVAAIQPYGKRRALFYCNNPECCDSLCTIGDENSCEGDRACGGSRERSQRTSPVPRGADRCGHRKWKSRVCNYFPTMI